MCIPVYGIFPLCRHPILDVRFKAFSSKCSQDVLASKGLLQVKVTVCSQYFVFINATVYFVYYHLTKMRFGPKC